MKSQRLRDYLLIGVVATICFMAVGYASFTTAMEINGTATVKAASWDIFFTDGNENEGDFTIEGAYTTKNGPDDLYDDVKAAKVTNNSTTFGGFVVSLVAPGDTYEFEFSVKNAGTFDAVLADYTEAAPTCTGGSDTENATVCDHVSFELTYADGTAVANDDTLAANETKDLKLVITYDKDEEMEAEDLPTQDITVSGYQVTFNYNQDV